MAAALCHFLQDKHTRKREIKPITEAEQHRFNRWLAGAEHEKHNHHGKHSFYKQRNQPLMLFLCNLSLWKLLFCSHDHDKDNMQVLICHLFFPLRGKFENWIAAECDSFLPSQDDNRQHTSANVLRAHLLLQPSHEIVTNESSLLFVAGVHIDFENFLNLCP